MPPSPLLRRSRSPARETYHKRANSFGNVLPVKSKDDELALFSDMQKVETENFLLEPSEDFDDSIGNACKFHLRPSLYSPIMLFFFGYLPFLSYFFPSISKIELFPGSKTWC